MKKRLHLDPQNSMIHTWLGRAYGRRAETSFAVSAIGHATKAREALEKAVQLDPKNGEAIDDLFDYYVQAPGFMGGGFDKARDLIPSIGEIDPAQAHYARARLAEQKKDFATAEAQFRRALHLAPNQVSRILELARFLTKRGNLEEGDQLYERARQISPKSPRLLFARAEMWILARKNVDQARELLKQYLVCKDLTPDDPVQTGRTEAPEKSRRNVTGCNSAKLSASAFRHYVKTPSVNADRTRHDDRHRFGDPGRHHLTHQPELYPRTD